MQAATPSRTISSSALSVLPPLPLETTRDMATLTALLPSSLHAGAQRGVAAWSDDSGFAVRSCSGNLKALTSSWGPPFGGFIACWQERWTVWWPMPWTGGQHLACTCGTGQLMMRKAAFLELSGTLRQHAGSTASTAA